jgi:hypothetical protein
MRSRSWQAYRKASKEQQTIKIETVQRWVVSVLIHVGGSPTLALAVYSPMLVRTNHTSGVGLWVMSGVVGLMTSSDLAALLMVVCRRVQLTHGETFTAQTAIGQSGRGPWTHEAVQIWDERSQTYRTPRRRRHASVAGAVGNHPHPSDRRR